MINTLEKEISVFIIYIMIIDMSVIINLRDMIVFIMIMIFINMVDLWRCLLSFGKYELTKFRIILMISGKYPFSNSQNNLTKIPCQ